MTYPQYQAQIESMAINNKMKVLSMWTQIYFQKLLAIDQTSSEYNIVIAIAFKFSSMY